MKNTRILLIIILACIAAFTIIHRLNKDNFPKIAPHNSPTTPKRIVSLAPNLTEILFALALDEKIVAVSNDSDYPPQTAKKKNIGTFWQPDTEAIIAAKPDLVVTLSFEQQTAVAENLKKLGYHTLSLKIERIDELFLAIEKIGEATGHKERADELIKNIKTQLTNLKSRLDSTNKPKVLWVVQSEPLRVAGRNTFINEFIELAGGQNAIGPTIQQYPPIGAEELLACRAQIIIHSAMATTTIDHQQNAAEMFWKKWPSLPAVKNNRIHVVPSDTVLRLGPRLGRGIELIARCLHPDIFADKTQTGRLKVNQ